MIKFLKTPYPCSFSKNDIHFKVNSDMYLTSVGAKPSLIVTVNVAPSSGAFYRFKFVNPETNKPDEFFFTTTNSAVMDSIYQIPYYGFAVPISDYIDDWVTRFQKQPSGNAFFTVERISATQFEIVAKQALEELKITFETNQTSGAISVVQDNNFVDPEVRAGYSATATVYYENEYLSGEFQLVASTPCVLDNYGTADFDVAAILNAEIENGWIEQPVPANGVNIYKPVNLKRYYVVFNEAWSGDLNLKKYSSEILFVHWGGVSTDDANISTPISLNPANQFLTFWPSGKKLLKEQSDWLSWMNKKLSGTFTVNLNIYTNVGTTSSVLHEIAVKKWETITFSVGYSQNDLQSLVPGETIQKWDFQIKEGDNEITVKFAYYLDRFSCLRHTILYFNSFGVCESVSTSGNWEEITNISTNIAEKSKSYELNRLMPGTFVFSSMHRNTFKATTGLLSKQEAYQLQPLLNSIMAYVREKNTWRPLIVGTKKSSVLEENQFISRVEIELIRANDNDRSSFYSMKPDIEAIDSCGITQFNVITNDLILSTYSNLAVYKGATLIQSIPWNGTTYPLATKIITNGEYRVSGTIDGMEIEKTIYYKRKSITVRNSQTGMKGLSIRSANPSETIYINWGEGAGTESIPYTDSLTGITHTFTRTGEKAITIEKPCFNDIVEFYISNMELKGMEFSMMEALETLIIQNSFQTIVYLSSLSKVKNVLITDQNVPGLKIGFQKALESITLSNTSIPSWALDQLILELWKYRQFYTNAVTLDFLSLGYTPSALFTAVKDGTGFYSGEGLVSDYSWTITTT